MKPHDEGKATIRHATPRELAATIRILREIRRWSQETLADVSGLNVRTIQRVENGDPSSLDTRRALARAFESEDMDVFNKPCEIPTPEQLQADKKRFEREHITVPCTIVSSGRELLTACTSVMADQATPATPLQEAAEEMFVALVDSMRDWRDCWDAMSEVSKLAAYREAQGHLDRLSELGISIVIATRTVALTSKAWKDSSPWPIAIIDLTAFQKRGEPMEVCGPA